MWFPMAARSSSNSGDSSTSPNAVIDVATAKKDARFRTNKKRHKPFFTSPCKGNLFDEACFLERSEGAILLNGAKAASRNRDRDGLFELRNVDALLLEVRIAANISARVELSSTSAVRVATADD